MPAARPTLYLVDAMSNIHRAYHAIRGLSTSAGRPTNAVYGFVTMLRKMLREHTARVPARSPGTGPEQTVRHEEYADYKANRPAMDDDLASQIPEIRRACEAYRIPVLELPGYEADDVIGTLSRAARAAGFDVVIVTADKDMLQLVEGPRVRVFHTGKEKFLDEAGVEEFFGVAPGQVVDVLALMGDASTTSPACRGVGEVTAKKWITEYGSLDDAARARRRGQGQGRREPARAHARTRSSRAGSSTIPTDLPIPFDPRRCSARRPTPEKLKELFVELEFHSLAAEIQGEVGAGAELVLEPPRRRASAFDVAPGDWPGVALLTRDGHAPPRRVRRRRASQIAEEARRRDPSSAGSPLERPGAKLAIAGRQAARRAARARPAARVAGGALRRVPRAVRALARRRRARSFEPMAFQRLGRKAHARQGSRRRPRRAARAGTRSSRPTAGSPSAPRRAAALARAARGRARRPARAREGLPRDRAAADAGPRAHGDRRHRDRRRRS